MTRPPNGVGGTDARFEDKASRQPSTGITRHSIYVIVKARPLTRKV